MHADTQDAAWRATGTEPPVFLDESGRRRRHVLAAAVACALGASTWLVGVVGGGVGFSQLPTLAATPVVSSSSASHHAAHGHRLAVLEASAALVALSGPSHSVHVVLRRLGDAREDHVQRYAALRPNAETGTLAVAAPPAERPSRT